MILNANESSSALILEYFHDFTQANNLLDIFPDAFIDKVGFTRLKVACSVFVAVVPVILVRLSPVSRIVTTNGVVSDV